MLVGLLYNSTVKFDRVDALPGQRWVWRHGVEVSNEAFNKTMSWYLDQTPSKIVSVDY